MANKLYRFAASIIFAAREGHCYPVTKWSLSDHGRSILNGGGLSQRQRLAQLYPHVIQQQKQHQYKLGHVSGSDVLFVQRTTEAGFMVCR